MSAESPLYGSRIEELSSPLEVLQKPSDLGLAIAKRGFKENSLFKSRMTELTGDPAATFPSPLTDRLILISARTIDRRLNDPSYRFTADMQYQELFAGLTAAEYFDLATADKEPEEVSELRDAVDPDAFVAFAKSVITANMELIPQQALDEDMPERLDSASALAQEKEVSVDAVFERDDLYEEFIRRNYTSEETARKMIAFIRGLTLSKITNLFAKFLAAGDVLDYAEGQEDDGDFAKELTADPEFKAQMRKERKTIISASRIMIREYIDRIWGESALDILPPEVAKALN